MRWLSVLFIILTLISEAHAKRSLRLRAELGPELDTNATQGFQNPITAGLLRGSAGGILHLGLDNNNIFSLDYLGGGKLFVTNRTLDEAAQSAADADEFAQKAGLSWGLYYPRWFFSLVGNYHDVFQRKPLHEFRTGAASVNFGFGQRRFRPNFTLGYRRLYFKPYDDFSFQGPTGTVEITSKLDSGEGDRAAEWTLSLGYGFALRIFDGNLTSCISPSQSCGAHIDQNHSLRASVHYLGNADLYFWYSLEYNASNHKFMTYLRHVVGLQFTVDLFWDVFLTAKGSLQINTFQEPYQFVADFNSTIVEYDEENRSKLLLQLARDLTSHLTFILRYNCYVSAEIVGESLSENLSKELQISGENAPNIDSSYLRQTVFAGFRMELDL